VVGNLSEIWALRQMAGLLNGVSLALFILTLLFSVWRGIAARKDAP
jgi:hypothetical protein